MMKKRLKCVVTSLLSAALLVGGLVGVRPVTVEAHGTLDRYIEEKELKNTPPKNYKINEQYQGKAKKGDYNKYFLKDDLQTVSLKVDDVNLSYLFQNANYKPTVMAESVTIADETYGYVGLKTKGNYTLQHTYSENDLSDRFSFSINFGKYINEKNYGVEQNFHGCDKISFNNFFFDKSMLKEYAALKIMTDMGVPTPQYGLAKLYINDQYYGVYFMIENMDRSILKQYLDVGGKELAKFLMKPMDTNLRYDSKMDKYLDANGKYDFKDDLKIDKKGVAHTSGVLNDQRGLWNRDGEDLAEVKDELSNVFTWQKKLTQLSEGKNFDGKKIDVNSKEYVEQLETIMDLDEVLRYFATQSFLVQNDNMFVTTRNFGLYIDPTGKCMILPWDYDLSFGCFYPSVAEATANFDIDAMHRNNVWGMNPEEERFTYADFPLFNVIYQNKELMKRYHTYMKDCAKVSTFGGTTTWGKVFEAGRVGTALDGVKDKLFKAAGEKMAKNAIYLNGAIQPDDVKAAFPNLKMIVALRAASVWNQVDGQKIIASGYGCNLATLGNAVEGDNTSTGWLTIADASTGIRLKADYSNHDKLSRPPSLKAEKVDPSSEAFQELKSASGVAEDSDLVVYSMSDTSEPKGNYTMYLPLEPSMLPEDVSVYCYTPEGVKYLESKVNDRTIEVESDSIRYVAVTKGKPIATWVKWLGVAAAILLLGMLVVAIMKKQKK